jgi:hypothetical protein
MVAGEERIEIGGAALDVFAGLEAVLDAQVGGGLGHELHEAAGAGGTDGAGIAAALSVDDAEEQIDVEIVLAAGGGENLGKIAGVEAGRGAGRLRSGLNGGWVGARVGELLDGGNLVRREFNVVVPFGAQIEAHATLDAGEVVTADCEAVAEGNALGGARGGGKRCEKREDAGDDENV